MRFVRGALTLVVGCALFLFCGTSTIVVALLCVGFGDPLLLHAPYWAGLLFKDLVYAFVAPEVRIAGAIEQKNVPTIVIGNHPSLPLTMLLVACLEALIGMPLVFVAKREHLWNPFIGWPLWIARLGIFINRKHRNGALEKIQGAMEGVFARGAGLVIFPCQSRATSDKILDDLRKFRGIVPELADFTETLVPREGGIGALLDAMPGVRVIDITFGCSQPNVRWSDILWLDRPKVLIRIEDVTDQIPTKRDDRRAWLVERWREKNEMIRRLAA